MKNLNYLLSSFILFIVVSCEQKPISVEQPKEQPTITSNSYQDLELLYQEWRTFETPPMANGAPDYTAATFAKREPDFKKLQNRLLGMDTSSWTVAQKIDWTLVWAEMNGYDFNNRILKPWERDPAYYMSVWPYRSDVPAHEGPTHHATTELWIYEFPLSASERERLIKDLSVITPLNEQAKTNLTGNAKDLWMAGIRNIKDQSSLLTDLLKEEGVSADEELSNLVNASIKSTDDLAVWLENEAKDKTGESGIGKDNYTWYLQNVHLVPLTWDDEVAILKRELARAWASLKLEEHRNRKLPQLTAVESPEAYNALADKAAVSLLTFLDKQDIVTVKDYFEPALRAHLGEYTPVATRNFFAITAHHDPRPLFSHFYHWFELARMDTEPHSSVIRRDPLLYNIFDSRNEGTATAVEEMFMQAGLYDDSPRSKELVYIMIAQRAARGLGSLYAHANDMTMEEAGGVHSEYTPRGWMKTEKELLLFEQHLYLRQPGYGTSYITGKYLLENALAEYGRKLELENKPFVMKEFLDQLNAIGSIPISLGQWEMTGVKMEYPK